MCFHFLLNFFTLIHFLQVMFRVLGVFFSLEFMPRAFQNVMKAPYATKKQIFRRDPRDPKIKEIIQS